MRIKYPLNSIRLQLAFHPFSWGTWFAYVNRTDYPERWKADDNTIWWIRLGCFTLSYSRML